jgi:hypothetical protein
MWDVVPSFQNAVSVFPSQKNLIFWHYKNGKYTFRGKKRKRTSMAFLAVPRAMHVCNMGLFNFLDFFEIFQFFEQLRFFEIFYFL